MDPTRPEALTVLVADDEAGVRQFCAEVLEEQGYRVLVAENGRYALEVAAAHQSPIHLLLSDVMMPELDGPDLAKQLRLVRPDIRVVFMSAYRGSMAALTYGYPFLQKPFPPDRLIQVIHDVLAQPSMPIPKNL
jgi:DNA-binding NtrC family response regulator